LKSVSYPTQKPTEAGLPTGRSASGTIYQIVHLCDMTQTGTGSVRQTGKTTKTAAGTDAVPRSHRLARVVGRVILWLLAAGLPAQAGAQALGWEELFAIARSTPGTQRDSVLGQLEFSFSRVFRQTGNGQGCREFSRTLKTKDAEWDEVVTYCLGSEEVKILVENPTRVMALKQALKSVELFTEEVQSGGSMTGVLKSVFRRGKTTIEISSRVIGNSPKHFIVISGYADLPPKPKPRTVDAPGTDLPESDEGEGRNHALVIGIDRYRPDQGLDPLRNAVKDAERLRTVLARRYLFPDERITFLVNPDRRSLVNAFVELRKHIRESDNLLVFYAGHGYWDEDSHEGYWLPSNAEKKSPADWISNSDIISLLKPIKCKHLLVLADACFSGTLIQKHRGVEAEPAGDQLMALYRNTRSRHALTSGAKEKVPDRSPFADRLIRTLETWQGDYLRARNLFIEIAKGLENNPEAAGWAPQPQYGIIQNVGDDGKGGDFIFIRKK
jgi:hypothetical protein